MFVIEEAHWFYEVFARQTCAANSHLNELSGCGCARALRVRITTGNYTLPSSSSPSRNSRSWFSRSAQGWNPTRCTIWQRAALAKPPSAPSNFSFTDVLPPAIQHLTDDIYKRFQAFKAVVPVFGAILLDPTHTYVLLVKGQKSNAAWGFPRGKISKAKALHC